MPRVTKTKPTGEREAMLATLMRTLVDARDKLARARERLNSLDETLRDQARAEFEKKRERALVEYREAMGQARQARMRLLRQLQGHTA